jgi:hypothetical protein
MPNFGAVGRDGVRHRRGRGVRGHDLARGLGRDFEVRSEKVMDYSGCLFQLLFHDENPSKIFPIAHYCCLFRFHS